MKKLLLIALFLLPAVSFAANTAQTDSILARISALEAQIQVLEAKLATVPMATTTLPVLGNIEAPDPHAGMYLCDLVWYPSTENHACFYSDVRGG